MFFRQTTRYELQDWITPPHVEVLKVQTEAERLQQLTQRVNELKKAMGPRYLCHEKNRVRRLDDRSKRSHQVLPGNISAVQHAV